MSRNDAVHQPEAPVLNAEPAKRRARHLAEGRTAPFRNATIGRTIERAGAGGRFGAPGRPVAGAP